MRRLLLLLLLGSAAAAQGTEARVAEAVQRGARFLLGRFDPEEGWGGARGTGVYGGVGLAYPYAAGPSALCCFALLKAGVPRDDPVLKKAFSFLKLKHRNPGVSYEISVLLLAVAERGGASRSPDYRLATFRPDRSSNRYRLPKGSPLDRESWTWMCELAQKLLHFQGGSGGWRYYPMDFHSGGTADVSSTQFALLALSTASRCGFDVKPEVFRKAREFLLAQQQEEGPRVPRAIHVAGAEEAWDRARGFPYIAKSAVPAYRRVSGGMTAAGLASLLLVRDELAAEGRDERLEQAVLDAFAWLGRYFTVQVNPGYQPFSLGSYHFCWLYALERSGDLMGREVIGERSWFTEGARYLLAIQDQAGAFVDGSCMQPQDSLGTAFALLFLTRASRPVSGG
ncbi:MAG: hypothetical protein ACT4PV_12815 [Planctomycetaceae bacterium]